MIEGTTTAGAMGSARSSPDPGLGGLGGDAFLTLLVAQLKYQNPMEPADGAQLLEQTAQFTQVETLTELAEAQRRLTATSLLGTASGLIGRDVVALGEDGEEVSGPVTSVRFRETGPEVLVGDRWIDVGSLLQVNDSPGSTDRPSQTQGTGDDQGATTP